MQFGTEALTRAQVQPFGHPTQRQGRFPPHSSRQRQLGRVALGARLEIPLGPTQPLEFFPDDPLRLGLGTLPLEFPGMMLSKLALHLLQELGLEFRRPQAPASPQRLPLRSVSLLLA